MITTSLGIFLTANAPYPPFGEVRTSKNSVVKRRLALKIEGGRRERGEEAAAGEEEEEEDKGEEEVDEEDDKDDTEDEWLWEP